jgi:hypothetical protein
LQQLVDGGNTQELKLEIDMSTPPESYDVYNNLMDISPFLSDSVIESAISKEDVLPNAMLRDIMVANPQSAKQDNLVNKIDERLDPMPEYMKSEIIQGKNIIGAKEELESNLAYYKLRHAHALDRLIRYYHNVSQSQEDVTDSLIGLYANENTLDAKYHQIFLALEEGEVITAENLFDTIPELFNLTAAQLQYHQEMEGYIDYLADVIQEEENISDPDSTEIVSLENMVSVKSGLPMVYARNILLACNKTEYTEPIYLPDITKSAIQTDNEFKITKSMDTQASLRIYPSPADNFIIIDFKLDKTGGNIAISDAAGREVKVQHLNKQRDQVIVDVSDFKSGLYIVSLYSGNHFMTSSKFTIK